MESVLLDVAGHRRSPATMPGYHRGRPPRNKGEQYPADPPTVEEIVAVMRSVGDRSDGERLRALIVLLWRAGLRISETLALHESDLDRARGAVLVRRGKGNLCCIRHRPPLPRRTRVDPRSGSRSVCSSSSASLMRRPTRQRMDDQGPASLAAGTVSGLVQDCDNLLNGGRGRPGIGAPGRAGF